MSRVYYNKLVRDFIQQKIKDNGAVCEVRTIEDADEFQQELLKKVAEEAGALSHTRSREDFLDEYADLMVVLDALTELMEFSPADIKTAITENLERKGKYDNKEFLMWSSDDGYKSNESQQGIKS